MCENGNWGFMADLLNWWRWQSTVFASNLHIGSCVNVANNFFFFEGRGGSFDEFIIFISVNDELVESFSN